MSHSIQCVHCKAILKSAVPVPTGKIVKCPKCRQTFTTGAKDLEVPDQAPATDSKPALSDDDEMAAAIAKLEADQGLSKKPAPVVQAAAEVKAAAVASEEEVPEIDSDDLVVLDEEEPRVKKKKRAADEEEDDEPRSKKKKRNDAEVDDDEPRRSDKKKKPRKAGSPMLLIGLIGGGVLGLFSCCGCSGGAYWFFFSSPVVGKWEAAELPQKDATVYWEFGYFGTGTIAIKAKNQQGVLEQGTLYFNYTITGSDPMIMGVKATRVEGFVFDQRDLERDRDERIQVNISGDTMTLTNLRGNSRLKLKRAR